MHKGQGEREGMWATWEEGGLPVPPAISQQSTQVGSEGEVVLISHENGPPS